MLADREEGGKQELFDPKQDVLLDDREVLFHELQAVLPGEDVLVGELLQDYQDGYFGLLLHVFGLLNLGLRGYAVQNDLYDLNY